MAAHAKNHDYLAGIGKDEDGNFIKYTDQTELYLPPSFTEFEKGEIQWLRPEEYLRELAFD